MGNNKRKIKKRRTEKMKPFSRMCHFCESDEDDEHRYGEFFHNDELSCHFFCLLFASGLSQNGDDEEGFYGFLFDDIQTELCRGTKLCCSYCKKKGATIGCCVTKCKKVFHFRCGCQNGALNQYFGSFRSFCKDHKPCQDGNEITKPKRFCHICFNRVSSHDDCLFSSCCNGDWFHRMCLQVYAFTAGAHHFKCPLCNNKDDFSNEMEVFGLYLPVKDAAWELEENAYQELYPRNECTAQPCRCPKGKKYRKNDTLWSLINCSHCGSHEAHKGCHHIMVSTEVWICDDCKEIDSRTTKQTSSVEIPQFADPGPSCPYATNNIESTPSSSFHSEVSLNDDEKLKLKPIVVLEKLLVASPTSATENNTQSTPAENCCGHGMCLMHFFTSNGKCTLHSEPQKLQNVTNITPFKVSKVVKREKSNHCPKISKASKSRKKKFSEPQDKNEHKKICSAKINMFFKKVIFEQYET